MRAFIDTIDFSQLIRSHATETRSDISKKLLALMEFEGRTKDKYCISSIKIPNEYNIIGQACERFHTNNTDLIYQELPSDLIKVYTDYHGDKFLYLSLVSRTVTEYKEGNDQNFKICKEYNYSVTKYGILFLNELQRELYNDGIEIGNLQVGGQLICVSETYTFFDLPFRTLDSNKKNLNTYIHFWASNHLINYAKEKKLFKEYPSVKKSNTESAPKNDLTSMMERMRANTPWPRYKKTCPECGKNLKRKFLAGVTCPNCGWSHL